MCSQHNPSPKNILSAFPSIEFGSPAVRARRRGLSSAIPKVDTVPAFVISFSHTYIIKIL